MKMRYLVFVTLVTIMLTKNAIAQNFPLGAFVGNPDYRSSSETWQKISELGVNTVVQHANPVTKPFIDQYNLDLFAQNEDNANEKITYYSRGYYKKWEAERNIYALLETGIKHEVYPGTEIHKGAVETYLNQTCWTTGNLSEPIPQLIYGPHYRQDKFYRLSLYNTLQIHYNARFKLALTNTNGLNPNTEVCRLSVVLTYRLIVNGEVQNPHVEAPLGNEVTLKVSDFVQNGFIEKIVEYNYPSYFQNTTNPEVEGPVQSDEIVYDDGYPGTGIEFRVNWYGVGKLYVDYVEVYDYDIGRLLIQQSAIVSQEIRNYALGFNNWNNLKYWYAADEPQTLDQYEPMRIVNSILNAPPSYPPLIAAFNPTWDGDMNGDKTISKFIELNQPQKLMVDYYPFWVGKADDYGLYYLRGRLQEAYDASKQRGLFYYVAQGFGELNPQNPSQYKNWRKPNNSQLNASVMLALSHGANGIFFWNYWSYHNARWFDGLVDLYGNPTTLYNYIKNSLAPRLHGILGNTLLNLNYTSDYINYAKLDQFVDFLKIIPNGSDTNWHAGLLVDKNDQINKHFLLVNLNTTSSKTARLSIKNNSDYPNLRVRSFEDQSLDITVYPQNAEVTLPDQTLQAGDGKLYQVAPVVKYGGKLKTSETISQPISLLGELIVESGATLTISANYDIYKNITVNAGGSIIVTEGKQLKFYDGAYLNVNGNLTANGSPTD
ncbi:MAG: hypothetical protein HXY50_15975, partial [Ignavibacteriaceae bacterium]|nr:hypothetical protein [Ignavibacteriaceae bacterium]